MSLLEQSQALVDRALVTLCAELPETLGLYNTARDQFTISAVQSVPMLEQVSANSVKYAIIRDWMRSYRAQEDQPLSSEISLDSLKQALKKSRKEQARLKAGNASQGASSAKSGSQRNGKHGKANGKSRRKANDSDEDSSTGSASTSTTSSEESDVDLESLNDSDVEIVGVKPAKHSQTKHRKAGREKKKPGKGTTNRKDKDKQRKYPKRNNLPDMSTLLSSDEDDEGLNELFDVEDPDVYEVECILDKRPARDYGQEDMYLIKWVGYDDPTWEPAGNISKDAIEEYEGQPVRENEYVVEKLLDRKTVRDKETHLKTFKYFVKWAGYEEEHNTWEPADNIPHNLRRKFDQRFEARKRRRTE